MAYDNRETEVRETRTNDSSTTSNDHVSSSVFAKRLVYYIGGALLGLLALRFILALLGANRDNAFANFIFSLSYPFVAPFFGLFGYEPSYGASMLELGTVVAIIFYALVIAGIAKLFTLNRRDPDVA